MAEFDFDRAITAVTAQPKPFNIDAALGVAPEGGLAAAAKQMVGQTIKGAGQLAADVAPTLMGDNAALRTGQEMIDANPTKVQGLRDIVESPWTATKEAVGNALPSMGGIIGLRALGSGITAAAPLAGPAAPIVAGLGQAVSWGGPAALAALPSYSGIRDAQTEAGLEGTTTQKLVAGAGAAASGAIEMLGGPQTRLLNALSSGLKREAEESLTKTVGKEALKSGLEEAGEELVQSPIEQLASYQDPTTAKNIQDTLFGGAMGLIGGGVLGGGMQAIAQKFGDAPPTDQAGRDTATTEDVQGQSLSNIVGAPTIVSNGQAYFSSGDGEFVVAPVEKLTEHFAGGGSVDTFNTAQATQEQLDKVGKFSLGYLTDLRNSDQALIQAGVNKKDVDALILSKVQDTPGRREYVASLLSSGRPDAQAVNEIGSGKIDSPNAPLQAEWMRQEEEAKVATTKARDAIYDRENRIAREQARIEEENRVIDYWRSIGAVDTVEEGRRLAALRAPFISPFTSPEGVTSPPVGELPPSAPAAAPSGGVSDQQLRGAAATTPAVTAPGDTASFITDQQLRGAAATTPAVTVQPAPLRLPEKKPADLNALLASSDSGRAVARGLADISKDKPIAAIAKRVAVTLGKDVKVVVVNPGDSIPARAASALSNSAKGVYRSGDRTVYLRSDKFADFNGVNDNTVLHELLHAATFDRLRAGNKASQKGTDLANATTALYKLQNTIADRFNAEIRSGEFYTKYSEDVQGVIRYAAFDVDEMISYGLSNAEFQNVLKTIQYKNTNETMFSQFTKLIRLLLGLSPKDQSALTSLIDMTDTLLSLPEPAVAVVNGQRVLREEVLFKPVDVNSANFKRWFAGSKVVDENGKPLVVYHGTTATFDTFKPNNNKKEQLGFGIHLTVDPSFASRYADYGMQGRKNRAGSVVPVYVAAKNILDADAIVEEGSKEYEVAMKLAGRSRKQLFANGYNNDGSSTGKKIVHLQSAIDAANGTTSVKVLRELGYDGVWYTSKIVGASVNGFQSAGPSAKSLVVFDPNQIKSAISNTGEFSLDDDRILMEQAGRSITAAQDDVTSKIAAAAAGAKVEYAPRWLSVIPLHTLVQTVGTKIKQVKRVEDILNEAEHISESMVTESMQYYTNAQNSKQADKINLVAGLASFYRVTPWKNIDAEVDWVPTGQKTRADKLKAAEDKWKAAGMDKSTGKSFVAAHTEAKRAFDALNPEAQKAYRAIVSHMQDIRQREKNNLRTFIEKASAGNDDLKQQLLTRFNSTFNDVRGAYWPLSRIGDFRLEYVDLDGTKVVQFFESDAARRDEMQDLQASGVDQQSFRLSFKDKRPRGEVAIPIELMTQLSTAVRNQKLSEASNDDPGAIASAEAEAQEIIDEMNQIWLRWQPETSALKNSLRRQNVKGFDQDMLRAYIEYTRKHAGNIAWTEQGRKLEDTLKSLHTEIIDDRNAGQDPTFKGMVLNDLRARLQAMREAKVGPIASFLGKVGTMWYMTSPSIALVQMTQLPILTLPKLAVKYGLGKASSAMGKGLRMAFSKDYTKDKLFGNLEVDALHDWLRMTVTAEMLENKGKNPLADRQLGDKQLGDFLYTKEDIESRYKQLSPEQQRIFILREALARNLLDISAAHEAYSLTQGKDPNSLTNKAFRLAMAPMRLSELASRKAAILSTMELSKEQGKGFFDTIKDVGEVVNDTLYSYSKANKPAVLQGGTARVLAMFQWYRIMTALRIGLMFKRSIVAETPEIRAAAQKEFIGIMGMTALLAGTLGLPLAKMVFSALDALADDDEPRDSELEFRKWAAERFGPEFGKIFTHGLPAAAGLNLTKRIGLDNLYGFQSEPPPRLHGKELALWYAGSQLGPAFGVFQSAFQGYDLMSKGEYMKGLEAALPKPIKDGIKAVRTSQEDQLTSMSGKRVIGGENLTSDAVLLMALGINPTEVEEAQTSSYAASKISVRISERRGRLIDASVKAILGDGDRDEAREAMLEFNKKMPRFAITGGDIRSALRRYRMEELGVQSKRDKMVAMQYEIPSY